MFCCVKFLRRTQHRQLTADNGIIAFSWTAIYRTIQSANYRNPAGTDPAYILRVAELYLIRAEARVKQQQYVTGTADLNAVCDRAGLTGTTATTEAELLLAIEQERRYEFPFEADRWFDLVRTGRAAAVLKVTDPNKLVWPIPASELLADKSLDPNPGY